MAITVATLLLAQRLALSLFPLYGLGMSEHEMLA